MSLQLTSEKAKVQSKINFKVLKDQTSQVEKWLQIFYHLLHGEGTV